MAPSASIQIRDDASPGAPATCQICLEQVPVIDQQDGNKAVLAATHLCSTKCSTVICVSCLGRHLQVALEVPYAGALPKVRCPICLVPLNKQQWERFMDRESREDSAILSRYTRLCEKACTFRCPECHDDEYIHLPRYFGYTGPGSWVVFHAPKLLPSQKARIPELRRLVRRFCRHRADATARDVVQFVVGNFAVSKVLRLIQCVLQRIQDEEWRATLLLFYHSVYPYARTLCCSAGVCFNCKRECNSPEYPCECEGDDQEVLEDDDCVQCRSCRVMLVKVEGCGVVRCSCDFVMGWDQELWIKRLRRRNLLPVDLCDITLFGRWEIWRRQIVVLSNGICSV